MIPTPDPRNFVRVGSGDFKLDLSYGEDYEFDPARGVVRITSKGQEKVVGVICREQGITPEQFHEACKNGDDARRRGWTTPVSVSYAYQNRVRGKGLR